MGFSEQALQQAEAEEKSWVIAGIPLRAPLKPIYTKPVENEWEKSEESEECLKTPTGEESRIPKPLKCPPPPKRNRVAPIPKCNYRGDQVSKVYYFDPSELESLFIRRDS
ncbi:hypothetical protein RGQ29_015465 [Quercus rubra]|uniref:Cyclin-dependent protein kinase inhibitor SMR6 n=1 Tax=Quercus rubra TaxID=3512 RepID=A0AAN7J4M7_QUERU|nr:hypothetical protein RGQ29_015465 [Quercus rubra]